MVKEADVERAVRWRGAGLALPARFGALFGAARRGAARPASDTRHDALARELQHRVKNNLQVISSLISLQAHHAADPATHRALEELKRRVLVIARAHEFVRPSADKARLDANDYLRAVVQDACLRHREVLERVVLDLHIEALALEFDRAVALGQITSELAVNALRHAFPGPATGRLSVHLTRDPAGATALRVEDDGIGLAGAPDWPHLDSLGLKLVRQLADKLDAPIRVHAAAPTRFEIVLPALAP